MGRLVKKYPSKSKIKFIACEALYTGHGGKLTLVGTYPGEIIVLHTKVVPDKKKLVGAINLALVFLVSAADGEFETKILLSGKPIGESQTFDAGPAKIRPDASGTIAFAINGIPIYCAGRIGVSLLLDDKTYRFPIEIRIERPPASEA